MAKECFFSIQTSMSGTNWEQFAKILGLFYIDPSNISENVYKFRDDISQKEIDEFIKKIFLKHKESEESLIGFNSVNYILKFLFQNTTNPITKNMCIKIARAKWHYDVAYSLYKSLGFFIGIVPICKAHDFNSDGYMNFTGNPIDLYAGAEYPNLRKKVIRHSIRGLRMIKNIYDYANRFGYLSWITSKGKVMTAQLQDGILPVNVLINIPAKDNSWMDNPITEESIWKWTQGN